jgi:hypothetical protein
MSRRPVLQHRCLDRRTRYLWMSNERGCSVVDLDLLYAGPRACSSATMRPVLLRWLKAAGPHASYPWARPSHLRKLSSAEMKFHSCAPHAGDIRRRQQVSGTALPLAQARLPGMLQVQQHDDAEFRRHTGQRNESHRAGHREVVTGQPQQSDAAGQCEPQGRQSETPS